MGKSTNKRQFSRAECTVPVEGRKDDLFSESQTVDFSKRGLGFVSSKPIPVGKTISIELDLDEYDDPVFVVGEVCWSREEDDHYRIGVQFAEILHGSKGRLDKYFRKQGVRRWI